MRSVQESRSRWQETVKHGTSFAELQRAVKFNGPNSPCVAGCRSVCWKAFLLFQDAPASSWSHVLLASRNAYSSLREQHMLYIKHPEKLAELTVDPLADEPSSPWDTFRNDELVRNEILQDVRRLPDEPAFYHQPATQDLILDVLFLWCKTHPEAGGYRQGMHELLAPMVYAVYQDAVDRDTATDAMADPTMVEMLDSYYVEHDSFALFSAVMDKAKDFYHVKTTTTITTTPPTSLNAPAVAPLATEQSAIVERSKHIHESVLMNVDPELSKHLTSIDILPQIFLIRWIRLLFGREFPFEEQLSLWDTLFAFDPSLELVDLVCVAMLLRIRWTLLQADYSAALQTLLKYPAPQAPHGPHTFVDDAIYLKGHLDTAGGAALVLKYTGRAPSPQPGQTKSWSTTTTPGIPRPSTPSSGFNSPRPVRAPGVRSPSASAARFLQQQASVEALFQGAAKNFIERGERLGLNQAVRDIRRNVQQGIHEARKAAAARSMATATSGAFGPFGNDQKDNNLPSSAELVRRNRQLAAMLEEAVTGLRSMAASSMQKDAIEMAAARVQFVQVYLEDPSLVLPEAEHEGQRSTASRPQAVAPDNEPPAAASTAAAVDAARHDLRSSPTGSDRGRRPGSEALPSPNPYAIAEEEDRNEDRMDTDDVPKTKSSSPPAPLLERPPAPIPTRSSIAQSSFSWMLEPDTPPSAAAAAAAAVAAAASSKSKTPRSSANGPFSSSAPPTNRKRIPASRERNAFLFGEVTTPPDDEDSIGRRAPPTSDEIFGLEPLRKALYGPASPR